MNSEVLTDEQLQSEIETAREAETVLEAPVLRNAVEILRRRYRRMWEESGEGDQAQRDQQYMKLRVLNEVLAELKSLVGKGEVANIVRERRRKR